MAIYHFEIKTYGRNDGANANAIKAAAYRAGARMCNDVTGQVHDYSRKSEVIHTEILAPRHAPEWIVDRSRLWNEIEKIETYTNARLFREFVVALPLELTHEQNIVLVRDFVHTELTTMGMIADWAFHAKPSNPHAHISCPGREISGTGFSKKKNRDWDRKAHTFRWRKAWADLVNRHLAQAGFGPDTFVDHRTLAAQGVDRLPTSHVGRETPDNKESHARKVARNRYVEQVNAAKALVASADPLDMLRTEVAILEAELATAEQVIADQPVCEPSTRTGSQERTSPQQVNAPISLDTLSLDDRTEFQARATFIQALGKPAYSLETFMKDSVRMAQQPGGSRLRWWLLTFKEAQVKYARSYGQALSYAPKDINRWMGQCWNVLGDAETWSQFKSEESAQAARTKVAWPGDAPRSQVAAETTSTKASVATLADSVRANVEPTQRHLTRVSRYPDGSMAIKRKHGPVEAHGEVALYSMDPGMRFYEMNMRATVPDAERLFWERRIVYKRLGRRYTWQHFYDDVRNLHRPSHPHQDMLDWWRDLCKEARQNGTLDSEPSKTLFLRSIPPRVLNALQQSKSETVAPAPTLRPELQSVVDGLTSALKMWSQFTRNAVLVELATPARGNDVDVTPILWMDTMGAQRCESDDYSYVTDQPKPLLPEYPQADIPVWVIPTLEYK